MTVATDSEKVPVLDHGYIQLIESWGSDERTIESARMSTNKGFLGWGGDRCPECFIAGRLAPDGLFTDILSAGAAHECNCKGAGKTTGDEKLLRYLYEHRHHTPFEMSGCIIEVQAPIFVFREWHRHRTQSYNEMSARYTPLPDINYLPTVDRLLVNSKTNTQASTIKNASELNAATAGSYLVELNNQYKSQEQLYRIALEMGVPKELARIHLPVARYSRMRASANLRNWLAFLTLRMDQAAQYEIRQYANSLCTILESLFPRTMELFNDK